ncbi:hypothetical protein HWV62_37835 [Athelia sp. TMB]|nr:hypothetical protein HWV62_37835 [Athelia sp. TMB]
MGHLKPFDIREFARFVVGMNTDHAEDQKKLVRLFLAWKESVEKELRGEEAMFSSSLSELLPLLTEETERNITDAGGLQAYQALSADERESRERDAYKRVAMRLGEEKLDALSPEERRYAALFIWGGCCMHKEMNSVKGGNAAMVAFWPEAGIPGPMKLLNRDNAAAANLAGENSDARKRAMDVSQAGGVKLTSLAGHIFANKDKKKGQQDTFKYELEDAIGYMAGFPDTSNVRYQSHCEAAAELITRLTFYRDFLETVRDLKEKRSWTNIECNVYDALHDIPTLTELAVLTLYSQSISHPYMRQVRGPNASETNLLDLGPLHDEVKAHCHTIIDNPSLLLSPDSSYVTGAMDGKQWERPEAVYAILRMSKDLPHLEGALVAFFKGALETWERFAREFDQDGFIASASASEKKRAFMRPTSDDNEGALGEMRVGARHAPNMTLLQHNARKMYRKNGVAAFIDSCLSEGDRKYLRRRAREIDSSGLAKQQREAQSKANQAIKDRKRKSDEARIALRVKKKARIDMVNPRLDPIEIQLAPGNVKELDLQLDWHRQRGDKDIPKKADLKRKDQKVAALIAAVERFSASPAIPDIIDTPLDIILDEDTEDEADLVGY